MSSTSLPSLTFYGICCIADWLLVTNFTAVKIQPRSRFSGIIKVSIVGFLWVQTGRVVLLCCEGKTY